MEGAAIGAPAAPWVVERASGSAAELHALDVPEGLRLVRIHEVTEPAVVLGSAQDQATLDPDALARSGRQLARRRSGGGAVLLDPGAQVWVDVVVPAGDPLWDDDVCRASWWLGEAWVASLGGSAARAGSGDEPAFDVHRGRVTDREASRVACFAAVGPGEVLRGTAKVVGISQRRTRHWARFQCVAYRAWDPADLVGLLAPPAATEPVVEALARVAPLRPGWDVVEDLLPNLPA